MLKLDSISLISRAGALFFRSFNEGFVPIHKVGRIELKHYHLNNLDGMSQTE